MHFNKTAIAAALFVGSITAAPTCSANRAAQNNTLAARSGSHRAIVYSDSGCSGVSVLDVQDFDCSGSCRSFGSGRSILLTQEDTGNPKPTAELFADGSCQDSVKSAGIYSGEHSGCTDADSGDVWGSVKLYFDC